MIIIGYDLTHYVYQFWNDSVKLKLKLIFKLSKFFAKNWNFKIKFRSITQSCDVFRIFVYLLVGKTQYFHAKIE